MKKVIIGFIAGAIFATAGSAFAASGLIGKKVQSEAIVEVNGNKVSSAIIIDGKSYAPIRDVSTALGATASYEKGVVKIETESTVKAEKLYALNRYREVLVEELDRLTKRNPELEAEIVELQAEMDTFTQDWVKAPIQHSIDTKKIAIEENKKRIAELQTQIDAIDAEIAALEGA